MVAAGPRRSLLSKKLTTSSTAQERMVSILDTCVAAGALGPSSSQAGASSHSCRMFRRSDIHLSVASK
eukprot:6660658-Karenia_brevis.AAC.1